MVQEARLVTVYLGAVTCGRAENQRTLGRGVNGKGFRETINPDRKEY